MSLRDFRKAASKIPEVRKIAVLRANAIGGFLFALSALEALRLAYPEAEITLLEMAWHQAFLAGRSGPIDRVVVVPGARGISLPTNASNDRTAFEEFLFPEAEETLRPGSATAQGRPLLASVSWQLQCTVCGRHTIHDPCEPPVVYCRDSSRHRDCGSLGTCGYCVRASSPCGSARCSTVSSGRPVSVKARHSARQRSSTPC